MSLLSRRFSTRRIVLVLGVVALALTIGILAWQPWRRVQGREQRPVLLPTSGVGPLAKTVSESTRGAEGPPVVRISAGQQETLGLRTVPVELGPVTEVLEAHGVIRPNESHYAYITPRASGVVRSVAAHIGQHVKAGDLLATIDSPEVAQARLDLITRLQELEIAHSQADWQEAIHEATLDLIKSLREGKSPEEIQEQFKDRRVGQTRETFISAYADYRLAKVTKERYEDLREQDAVSLAQYQQELAQYEAALAKYQGLMDRIGYESTLAYNKSKQTLRASETAVRVARERLRVLGVKPDGTEPVVQKGHVVGVQADGTLPGGDADDAARQTPEEILPRQGDGPAEAAVAPVGSDIDAEAPEEHPVSTYSIWAPFDGTILDRELIVPGVAVDLTHRIFTLANLESVWVEVLVHEHDFAKLSGSRRGEVTIRSAAYPDMSFAGQVLYTGDLVDEQTRRIKLLAEADNPGRLLKPGMFVNVEVAAPSGKTAPTVPESALITEDNQTFVFVRNGPEEFQRRRVVVSSRPDDAVTVRKGLKAGEEVVVQGSFLLKSAEVRLADAAP